MNLRAEWREDTFRFGFTSVLLYGALVRAS